MPKDLQHIVNGVSVPNESLAKAMTLLSSKQYDEAMILFSEAMVVNPLLRAECCFNTAICFYLKKMYYEAIHWFENAVVYSSSHSCEKILLNISNCWSKLNNHDYAHQYLLSAKVLKSAKHFAVKGQWRKMAMCNYYLKCNNLLKK